MSTTEPTSRRDYFAANAPAEVPEWFQPNMDHLRVEAPSPDAPADVLKAWSDGVPQRMAAREEYRFFAWRWYYAEQMIKTNPIKPGLHL